MLYPLASPLKQLIESEANLGKGRRGNSGLQRSNEAKDWENKGNIRDKEGFRQVGKEYEQKDRCYN